MAEALADTTSTKKCGKCGKEKPFAKFSKHRRSHDGLQSWCKGCWAAYGGAYRAKHRDKIAAYRVVHYAEHREDYAARNAAYRAEHPAYDAVYRAENRDKIAARKAAHYAELREDPRVRFLHSFGNHIRRALNGNGASRAWSDLVGYSREDLIGHMERQFADGMAWASYGKGPGKWGLHHIQPVSTFDFERPDDPEFLECWALDNMVPLWFGDHVAAHAEIGRLDDYDKEAEEE